MTKDDKSEPAILPLNQTVAVPATACLWFAWAPAGTLTGPEGESGNTFRPVSIAIAGESQLTISTSGGPWQHDPDNARQSGPNGIDGTTGVAADSRGLENSAYKNSLFNSLNINILTTHLNKLVGIFEINNAAPTVATDQQIIGAGASLTVPAGATRLYLGFHDGRHWTNNSGSVTVTVASAAKARGPVM